MRLSYTEQLPGLPASEELLLLWGEGMAGGQRWSQEALAPANPLREGGAWRRHQDGKQQMGILEEDSTELLDVSSISLFKDKTGKMWSTADRDEVYQWLNNTLELLKIQWVYHII